MTSSSKFTADAFIVKPWAGENPFWLMVVPEPLVIEVPDGPPVKQPQDPVKVDLDEHGWKATLKDVLESPGEWFLVRKKDAAVIFSLVVRKGDQPYYVARHIRNTGIQGEAVAYGIGKKAQRFSRKKDRWIWNEDNLWILQWGQICGGTDVEHFAIGGMRKGLHRG